MQIAFSFPGQADYALSGMKFMHICRSKFTGGAGGRGRRWGATMDEVFHHD
jgi:hypothetical protein